MRNLIVFAVLLIFAAHAQAAIPKKSDAPPGITIESPEGFALRNLSTKWFQSPPPPEKVGIHMQFRSPDVKDGYQGLMTIRIDKETGNAKDVKQYVKKWLGDYQKLGYKVLGSKPFKQGSELAYVIDVKNEKSKKQVRQVVFFRPNQAVVLTCIDKQKQFSKTLNECNNITRSFAFLNSGK
ncbi:MAG: hypothetical protein KDD25_00105 [Bdellovibrionales bacterium]|nr:hypothetical protein [Bdellovibrionales bacterium]